MLNTHNGFMLSYSFLSDLQSIKNIYIKDSKSPLSPEREWRCVRADRCGLDLHLLTIVRVNFFSQEKRSVGTPNQASKPLAIKLSPGLGREKGAGFSWGFFFWGFFWTICK